MAWIVQIERAWGPVHCSVSMLAMIWRTAFPCHDQEARVEVHGIGTPLVCFWFGNIRDLKEIYKFNKLWDLNYEDYLRRHGLDQNDGDMGRVYGQQWRYWRKNDGSTVDQLQERLT